MTQKSESSFEEDDFVVYPTHGVGRILGTEKREVAGIILEMLVVRFEHDRMTLRVPLEKARSLGDILVVALNTDASVRRLKGKERPLNSLKDRMTVIAALASVDYVTSFGEDTPLKLIQSLLPDVLVKGGDWSPSQMIGSDVVLKNGGKVKSIRFIRGKSTTRLIRKARKPRSKK